MRRSSIALAALLLAAACGEADLAQAGRNAAWAAVEASNPELVQGLRAAQTLRQAAAACGWQDVDAAAIARTGVAGIEDPAIRAAAGSLVQDLLVNAPASETPQAVTSCSPETRRALESQVTMLLQGESENGEAG